MDTQKSQKCWHVWLRIFENGDSSWDAYPVFDRENTFYSNGQYYSVADAMKAAKNHCTQNGGQFVDFFVHSDILPVPRKDF